jgi:hypothetical protein
MSRRSLTHMVLALAILSPLSPGGAMAQDDARIRQLRLLCAQLSGDLTDPGGIAAFRRCLTTHNPLGEIKRDNHIGGGGTVPKVAADRPNAKPPAGFGHDGRRTIAEGIQRFTTNDGRIFYASDKDGKLWRWDPATKDSYVVDDKVTSFRIVDDGHLLVLGTDGRLWLEPNIVSGRVLVDEKVADFQPIAGVVYVRGTGGDLWREIGNAAHRTLIDHQVTAFQAIDANQVDVLGSDGRLWREIGDARDRKEVASTVEAFQYLSDGDTTYVLARDGSLWRQEGAGKPDLVDRNVAAFQAVDMHLAFVLGKDGRLWKELGNREQAVLVDSGVLTSAGRAAFQATDGQNVYVLSDDKKLWAETMPPGR